MLSSEHALEGVEKPIRAKKPGEVAIFGTHLHNKHTWCVGYFPLVTAQELVAEWMQQVDICTYEIRQD